MFTDNREKKAHMAYWYAFDNHTKSDFNVEHYQVFACLTAPYAYAFARDIPGADIEYCRKACEHDKERLNRFDKMIIEKVML